MGKSMTTLLLIGVGAAVLYSNFGGIGLIVLGVLILLVNK